MKILLPIDGSDCADKTLAWAVATFNAKTTEYYLLNVIPVLPDLMAMDFDIVEATAILKKAKAFLQSQHCHVAQVTYLLGDAVEEICRFSEIQDIDHVVIGSHGRSGLAKLLMGSVGVGVLENCPRPVIVYRYLSRNSDTQRTEVLCSDNMI